MVNAVKVFTLRLCISAYYIHFKRVKVKIFTAFTITFSTGLFSSIACEKRLIYGKKPVWIKEHCTLCLRCLRLYPKFSIQYGDGKTKQHGRYNHP